MMKNLHVRTAWQCIQDLAVTSQARAFVVSVRAAASPSSGCKGFRVLSSGAARSEKNLKRECLPSAALPPRLSTGVLGSAINNGSL